MTPEPLLRTPAPPPEVRRWRVLSRRGKPLLYLPVDSGRALATLALYPAQTRLARVLKRGLALACRFGLPLPLPLRRVEWDAGAPLVRFFARFAAPGQPLEIGMLAGNPSARGQRYVLLLFAGQASQPVAVIKLGIGPEAEALVAREAAALRSLPPGLPGVVPLLEVWEGEGKALALPVVAGEPPTTPEAPETLLHDWLSHGSDATLGSLEAWRKAGVSGFDEVVVRAPVVHGDLAPWNIREHEGRWTVLDWERGALRGVPGWDWFHYTLQPGVLVEKWSAERLATEAKAVLACAAFQRYAAAAQIAGLEQALLLGYLGYCTEVIGQTEGAEALRSARVRLKLEWQAVGVKPGGR